MADPADPSSTLEAIKERSAAALEFPASGFAEDSIRACTQSALDVPFLVAALEAVLKLADTWDRVDARLSEMGRESAPIGDLRREMSFSHAKVFEDCATALREAITRTLNGDTDA